MRITKATAILGLIGWMSMWMSAAEPANYYTSCEGKSGANLLKQLQSVVGSHTNVGYDGLWDVYETADVRDNGTVWDMYSTSQYPHGSKHCGNYKNVGDCYNREHSIPQSWFNEASPMKADAFHVYPTDGKVNGQRSNYPYGECSGGTTLPSNNGVKALGKLGKSTFSGYSGTVFEPDDEYKGDFARTYFYMAAAYNDRIGSWSGEALAGNSYPAFNTWTVNLLLKWHRQDPVSKKERDRNEAVYAKQKNRNPFIDHPDLAEHIWGDKKTTGWTNAAVGPQLILPAEGASLNFGTTMTNVARTATIVVKGSGLSSNVSLTVSGSGFSLSSTSLTTSAVQTDNGASVTVTFRPASTGHFTGSVKVTCGTISRTVTLSGDAIATVPAGPVTAIGDDSFDAVWTNVGDTDASGKYTLNVMQNGISIAGYPKKVTAADEEYTVEALEPLTTYTYTVSSQTHVSAAVTVTTLAPIPSVDVYFDGTLEFVTEPGEPSDAAELLLFIDNISAPLSLSVGEPFQLSSDKADWSRQITIDPDQERVYLRIYSEIAGSYAGRLTITSGDYRKDNVEFNGIVGTLVNFYEDFEVENSKVATYYKGTYQGTAAEWNFYDVGIFPKDTQDVPHGGKQALRFGKEADSSITMNENTAGGVGTVTLWARVWNSDGTSTIELQYSTDNGSSWKSAGSASVAKTSYEQFTFNVRTFQPTRLRVLQTSGKRLLLDDIEATPLTSDLVPAECADYHRWDAFCRDGRLVIEASEALTAHIYSIDGSVIFAGRVAEGLTELSVAGGLYIVVVDDFGRRVLVK